MEEYDALEAPDPEEWLALDESERIELIRVYHKRIRFKVPGQAVHDGLHAAIEVQLAERIPEVVAALDRLLASGLDRHEALHAILSVLSTTMFEIMNNPGAAGDPNPAYYAALNELTVESWHKWAESE